MDDTKTPDGEAQLAKDMTAAEFRVAKAAAIAKSYAELARQRDAADLERASAAGPGKKDAAS